MKISSLHQVSQIGTGIVTRANHLTSVYRLTQSITGTVIAKASVEINSMEAVSDCEDLYRAAKSTTTVARGKLQYTLANHVRMDIRGEINVWSSPA